MPWIPSAGAPLGTPQFSGAHLLADAGTNVPDDVSTAIALDTVIYDTDAYWSALNPTRLTAPTGGYYHIGAMFNPDSADDTTLANSSILLNDDSTIARFTQNMDAGTLSAVKQRVISTDYLLAAGDFVEMVYSQTNVALQTIDVDGKMWIHRISGGTQGIQGEPGTPGNVVLDYVQRTSFASITATTDDGADQVLASNTVTYDGATRVRLTCFCPEAITGADDGTNFGMLRTWLFEDGTRLARMNQIQGGVVFSETGPAAITNMAPLYLTFIFTPSAGDHSYSVRGTVDSANNDGDSGYEGGTGASNQRLPCYLMIETLP